MRWRGWIFFPPKMCALSLVSSSMQHKGLFVYIEYVGIEHLRQRNFRKVRNERYKAAMQMNFTFLWSQLLKWWLVSFPISIYSISIKDTHIWLFIVIFSRLTYRNTFLGNSIIGNKEALKTNNLDHTKFKIWEIRKCKEFMRRKADRFLRLV